MEVQKPSNCMCYTPSSEPFRIYFYGLSFDILLILLTYNNLTLSEYGNDLLGSVKYGEFIDLVPK
jgi:hypothetical protein